MLPSIFYLPTNFNSWTRLREQEVRICLRGTSSMRLESHYLRISPVDELGRPWSCRPNGPISRLTSIYPRISSDFTCVCLRQTDSHNYLSSTTRIEGRPSRLLAQRSSHHVVGYTNPFKQPCCIGLTMPREVHFTSFSSSDAEQNEYAFIIISRAPRIAWFSILLAP